MKLMLMQEKNNKKRGVKTDAGKEVSKYNAQKHSILRDSPTEYEGVDVSVLREELFSDLEPKGRMQEVLIDVIVINTMKLARVVKSESEYVKQVLSPIIRGELDVVNFRPTQHEYQMQVDFTDKKFLIFSRYQTAMENRIYKALFALKNLQNEQGKKN